MTPQELKNSILQRAIQGELVEQRPEEGTGEELYQKIQAEKRRLIKEKKIKKEKPLPEIKEEEIPFDIPDSWTWKYLSEFLYTVGSKNNQIFAKDVKASGRYPAVSQGVALIDGYCDDNTKVIDDLPLVMFGDHTRNVKYIDFPFVISADGTKFLKTICVDTQYFYYWVSVMAEQIRDRGYARHFNLLKQMPVPLPPLAEQRRIVAKIEDLLPYIDRYAVAWNRLEELNRRFPADMRKSLLQMAIQGKLVEQRPEEGSGDQLYQRIQAEKRRLIKEKKLKKEKPLSEIKGEEIPFDIPDNWKWVRTGNVITLLSGMDFSPEGYNENKCGIPYITGASNLSGESIIINRWTDIPKVIANNGDIILVCKGSGYGKTAICNVEAAHIARQLMAIKKSDLVSMHYIRQIQGTGSNSGYRSKNNIRAYASSSSACRTASYCRKTGRVIVVVQTTEKVR